MGSEYPVQSSTFRAANQPRQGATATLTQTKYRLFAHRASPGVQLLVCVLVALSHA